jgi:hypothetical protein
MKKQGYHFENNMISTQQILTVVDQAIKNKKSFSLSRFGIGEVTFLMSSANSILIQQFQRYIGYAGITCSYNELRRELIGALKTVDIAGLIPSWRLDFWAEKTEKILNELKYTPARTCCAWVMHDVVSQGLFWPWIRNKKVVLVGRRSVQAVSIFEQNAVQIMGSVGLEGYEELDQAYNYLMELPNWDLALVSAGIPATILVPKIAKTAGKAAIDFGHALDFILDGEKYDHLKLVKQYNNRHEDRNGQDKK